jgi:hypothetical protein
MENVNLCGIEKQEEEFNFEELKSIKFIKFMQVHIFYFHHIQY